MDGVLDGDFALESIVIVTGPYHDRILSEGMRASHGFRFTSLQSETCIIAPNFPSGNVVQVSWRIVRTKGKLALDFVTAVS